MTFAAAPNKNEISATPSPTNATANAGFGKVWDWLSGLLGTGGKPEHVYAAMKLLDPKALLNLKPTFGVNANALTITLKGADGNDLGVNNPGFVSQRHATLSEGTFNKRKLEANVALTISAGSSLGHAANFLLPVYLYLLDNAGAQELAASRAFFGEGGIVTTTAEGGAGAADSATVMYSAAARASVPFRLIGIAWFTQAVAGNWVNLPSEVRQPPFHLELVGELVDYGGGAVPYGYFLRDGSNVSRTIYAKLFGSVGTAFGVGDGATTFGVGDDRRRTYAGSGGTGTGALGNAVGNTGGAETHTLAASELPTTVVGGTGLGPQYTSQAGGSFPGQQNTTLGGGGSHPNLQPTMVVTKMVRWLGDIC